MEPVHRSKVMCRFIICLIAAVMMGTPLSRAQQPGSSAEYVGSSVCAECHASEYDNYRRFSTKATSFERVERLLDGLTASELKGCFDCHTTGHRRPGGFLSKAETPELRNVGCETCHGPGSLHVDSESTEDIRRDVSTTVCMACHNEDRIRSFRFNPLKFAGAH